MIQRARSRTALAAAACLAATGAVLAPAATQAQGSPVQHVVVIYLENHSFDNVLGFWCQGIAGGTIQRAMGCTDASGNYTGMPAKVTLSDGTVVTPAVDPDKVPAVNHNTKAQQAALNVVNGVPQMNGWQNIPASGKYGGCGASVSYDCISGYQPSQVPNLTALAGQFAISDETFSLADSPSWEGHMDIVAATTDGFSGGNPFPVPGVTSTGSWGCDGNRAETWTPPLGGKPRSVPSCVPDWRLGPGSTCQYATGPAPCHDGGAFAATPVQNVPTIMDRLDAASLPWKIYGATAGEQGYGVWDICPTFASCLDTPQNAGLADDSQFLADAAAGTLPAFSVVTPGGSTFADSCHNYESMTACDNWVASLVGAVESSPEWSSTAIFITFDDCGCFYDQVPPPLAPDGTQEGPRVPLIIVSPYARPGFTGTTPATFASILAFTEHNFDLAPLGPNDAYAYDFSGAFCLPPSCTQPPVKPARLRQRPLPSWARNMKQSPALLDDPS